ncbi:MAG: secretory protein [Frankiales bacterium]|nr:secretory protein [Frankiales bacterium]
MLARIRKAQENNEGGFTLIELLVVMIIIGILAAIAIPAFLSQKEKGYEASVKSDLRSIATEISTQLVDEPTSVSVSIANGVATVTPTPGTAGTINLSPNNAVEGTPTVAANGDYCVALKNSKGGAAWQIKKAGATTQVLSKGNCSTTPPAAP